MTSEAKIKQLAEVVPGQGQGERAPATVRLGAIEDYFETIAAQIRRVEDGRQAAEPSHLAALQDVRRAGLSPAALEGRARRRRRVLPHAPREGRAGPRRRGPRHARQRADVAALLLPRRPWPRTQGTERACSRCRTIALASRLSYFLWSSMPDAELLAHAAAGDLHKPEVLRGPGPADAPTTRRPAAWRRSSAATGSTSAASRSTTRRPRAVPDVRQRAAAGDVRGAGPLLRSTSSRDDRSGARFPLRQAHVREPGRSPGTTACPSRNSARTTGCGSTTPTSTAAAGCCRWRCS